MQITIQGRIYPTESQKQKINKLMRLQSSCMRYAYNRLCERKSKSEIEKDLKEKFSDINSRYRRGGYFRARDNFKSAEELVKLGELESKGKLVFGRRKNLKKRERGEITKEEWKKLRNNQVYSRGDKSKCGNLNLRLIKKNEKLYLRINVGDREWIEVPAYLPEEKERFLSGEESYGVRILRKNGKYKTRINFEKEKEKETNFEKGSVGVDFNHSTIDLAVIDEDGQLKDTKTIHCSDLTSSKRDKRKWLIGNYAKEVLEYAKYWNRGITTENLSDVARKQSNQHEFTHRRFLEALRRRSEKEGVSSRSVNPAFTSIIGKWKFSDSYQITTHQASAFVIARRGKGIHEKLRGLKTLAFEAMEAREGNEGVPNRRVHSWSLWSLIGNLPSRKGAEHTNSEPRSQHSMDRRSNRESCDLESSGASVPTERSFDKGDLSEGKIVNPGNDPPKA